MNKINIDLSKDLTKLSITNPIAHEFEHAYQFYTAQLGFAANTSKMGASYQRLEDQAYQRGNLFSGNSMLNNGSHKINSKALNDYSFKNIN
jgi:hypothetical protein